MMTKKKDEQKGSVKTLQLKRETIKDLSASDKKKLKGGGGLKGSVVQSRVQS
jgi:hypothetical protein